MADETKEKDSTKKSEVKSSSTEPSRDSNILNMIKESWKSKNGGKEVTDEQLNTRYDQLVNFAKSHGLQNNLAEAFSAQQEAEKNQYSKYKTKKEAEEAIKKQRESDKKYAEALTETDKIDFNDLKWQLSQAKISDKAVADRLRGVFGIPYQFSTIVDPVPLVTTQDNKIIEDPVKIGRKYNEKILSVAPILFLTPGEPLFMGDAKNADIMERMALSLATVNLGGDDDKFEGQYDRGRYYTFKGSFQEYTKYVNVSVRVLSYFLGIGNITIPVPGKEINEEGSMVHLREFDVHPFLNQEFTKSFGTLPVLPFFLDASDSISESFSNSSTDSALASQVSGISSQARELQFFAGGSKVFENLKDSFAELTQPILDTLGKTFADNTMIQRVFGEVQTVASGGKIVFPQIWADSSYSKNFDISLKLRSPDPDPVSIFLNIYLPLLLLIAMGAPRQVGAKANAYKSPFLVRAVYRSMFSCDLGMIESISINRGGDHRWNKIGMPLSVDVNISIRDLYSNAMFISSGIPIIENTAQLDYLSNLAGLDLNEEAYGRKAILLNFLVSNVGPDAVRNLLYGGKEAIVRRVMQWVPSILRNTTYDQI